MARRHFRAGRPFRVLSQARANRQIALASLLPSPIRRCPLERSETAEPSVVQQARFLQQTDILLSHHLFLAIFSYEKPAGYPL